MKAVITLFFVFIFGATALANLKSDVKIDGIEMGIVLVNGTDGIEFSSKIETGSESGIVRLYKFQNARITKALEFVTKKTSANLA